MNYSFHFVNINVKSLHFYLYSLKGLSGAGKI
jgi:hypothetical protein